MRIKLNKNKRKFRTAKNESMELVGMPKDLEEIDFGDAINNAADLLGLTPEILVELWVTKTYPQRVKRAIYDMPKVLGSLRIFEEDKTVKEIIAKRSHALSVKERRDIENRFVNELILGKSTSIIQGLIKKAEGFTYDRYDSKNGGTVTIESPPDVTAASYLLDRALGKPVAISEGDGKSGANIGKVQIFLPDNGRQDGPKTAVIDYSEIVANAIDVTSDEQEEG